VTYNGETVRAESETPEELSPVLSKLNEIIEAGIPTPQVDQRPDENQPFRATNATTRTGVPTDLLSPVAGGLPVPRR
jgi:hypothetical protein